MGGVYVTVLVTRSPSLRATISSNTLMSAVSPVSELMRTIL